MSSREETLRQTQDTLERLHLLSGLGTARHRPGTAGGSAQRQGGLGVSAETALDKQKTTKTPKALNSEKRRKPSFLFKVRINDLSSKFLTVQCIC